MSSIFLIEKKANSNIIVYKDQIDDNEIIIIKVIDNKILRRNYHIDCHLLFD